MTSFLDSTTTQSKRTAKEEIFTLDDRPTKKHTTHIEDNPESKFLLDDEENPHHVATSGSGHFIGIQPLGNIYLSEVRNCRDEGLGPFARFSDTFLIENILSYLDGVSLARLSTVSKAFYAFSYATDTDLWKPLVIDFVGNKSFEFQYYWRNTFAYEYQLLQHVKDPTKITKPKSLDSPPNPPVKLNNFFSDELFQPWYCGNAFDNNKDAYEKEYNVDRIDGEQVSIEEFYEKYAEPCKPVVIMNIVNKWPAYKGEWSVEALLKNETIKNTIFSCGVSEMTISQYLAYSMKCINDDAPLYLFDKKFGEKAPSLLHQYQVPKYFTNDFYSLVDIESRPSYRWWLIGPRRSGSSFHKDPLYTHAWNGLISGKKKWILYPPHITPPGVICSPDHLEVITPLSIAEWYLSFYHQTQISDHAWKNKPDVTGEYDHIRDFPHKCSSYRSYKPVEIMQHPGDIVFIPSQWWHAAINYEFSIAITQNILNQTNYLDGIKFLTKLKQHVLRDKVEKIVNSLYPDLHTSLEQKRVKEREKALLQDEQKRQEILQSLGVKKDMIENMTSSGTSVHITTNSIVSSSLATFFNKHRTEQAEIQASLANNLPTNTDSPSCAATISYESIPDLTLEEEKPFSFEFSFSE